ncbi:MAG: DoxX family protein [Candidatus Dependentiae bacterium]|nr:DoxX family protein [Candidatus Dependentiae bacterium]
MHTSIINQDWAILIIRLILGSVFILHGGQKMFGWLGGSGLQGWLGYMASLQIPTLIAYLPPFIEFFGGLCILLGIAAEVGAFGLLAVMLVGIYLVHWDKGYFSQNGGYEYALNLALLCLAIILAGSGPLSLWNLR